MKRVAAESLKRLVAVGPRVALATAAAVGATGCGAGTGSELGSNAQLFVVDAASGERSRLTTDEATYWSPSWSPDGKRLAVSRSTASVGTLEVVDADDGSRTTVARGGFGVVSWAPRGETLAFMRFREASPPTHSVGVVETDGSGRRRLAAHERSWVAASLSWAPDGSGIAYTPGRDLFVVPAGGGRTRLLADGAWDARWSPDRRSVLTLRKHALLSVPVEAGAATTVASGLIDAHPSWSPSSDRVAIAGVTWDSDRRYHLYLASPGSGEPLRRLHDDAATVAPAWSPDGTRIAFADFEGAVRVQKIASGETTTLTRLDGAEIFGLTWSPDGARIAFVANRRHEGD